MVCRVTPRTPAPRAQMTPTNAGGSCSGSGCGSSSTGRCRSCRSMRWRPGGGVAGSALPLFPDQDGPPRGGRRRGRPAVLRTVRPDAGVTGEAAVRQIVERATSRRSPGGGSSMSPSSMGGSGRRRRRRRAAGVTAISLPGTISPSWSGTPSDCAGSGSRSRRLGRVCRGSRLQSAARAVGEGRAGRRRRPLRAGAARASGAAGGDLAHVPATEVRRGLRRGRRRSRHTFGA